MTENKPAVGIVYGSPTDEELVKACGRVLDHFEVAYESVQLSAHRDPNGTADYADGAQKRGIKVLIGIAGMAGSTGAGGTGGVHAGMDSVGIPGNPGGEGSEGGIGIAHSLAQSADGPDYIHMAVGVNNRTAGEYFTVLHKHVRADSGVNVEYAAQELSPKHPAKPPLGSSAVVRR